MSLYNMIHGVNPLSAVLLAMVGVRLGEVPRFRDTFLFDREDGELGVAIYTRTGGGNREEYSDDNGALTEKPLYLWDEDDDFDCTYATFYFRVPAAWQERVREIEALGGQKAVPADSWRRLFRKLAEGDTDDPEVQAALEVGRPILERLGDTFGEAGRG